MLRRGKHVRDHVRDHAMYDFVLRLNFIHECRWVRICDTARMPRKEGLNLQ